MFVHIATAEQRRSGGMHRRSSKPREVVEAAGVDPPRSPYFLIL